MAIIVTYNTPYGVIPCLYAKVATYSGDKTTVTTEVEFFASAEARTNGLPPLHTTTFSLAYPKGVDLLTGLYTALKAEASLAGAVDDIAAVA